MDDVAIRQAFEGVHGDTFALTTILSVLLLKMHEQSADGARLVSETLHTAGEMAGNASMALGHEHTTAALQLIEKLQQQIVDPMKPKADPTGGGN